MSVLSPVVRPVFQPVARSVFDVVASGSGPDIPDAALTSAIGDSWIGAGSSTNWFVQTCMRSGQRLRFHGIFGVGGETSTQIRARIGQVIQLNPAPKYCVIGGNTNDYASGVSPSTARENYVAMVSDLLQAGIEPILTTTPSCNVAGTGDFNTIALRRAGVMDHNAWINSLALDNGLMVLDVYSSCVGSSGELLSTSDGVHINGAGAFAVGGVISANLPPAIQSAPRAYLTDSADDPRNSLSNGTFEGTASGGVAAGWGSYGTGASFAVENSSFDAVGNMQRASNTSGQSAVVTKRAACAEGDDIEIAVAFMNSVNSGGVQANAQFFTSASGGSAIGAALNMMAGNNLVTVPAAVGVWRVAYLRLIAPPGAASVLLNLFGTGNTGSAAFARATVLNLSQPNP